MRSADKLQVLTQQMYVLEEIRNTEQYLPLDSQKESKQRISDALWVVHNKMAALMETDH